MKLWGGRFESGAGEVFERFRHLSEIALGTNPANAQKAIASVEAEVKRIREQGVTQREVEEAVAYLTGRFPLRLETNRTSFYKVLSSGAQATSPDFRHIGVR